MEIISNIALISINETLFVQVGSFLIFLFLMNRIMFRPLNQVIGDRGNYMDKLKQDVLDAAKEIDSLTSQLEKREAAAKQEAFAFRKELEATANEEIITISLAVKKEVAGLKEEATKDVEAKLIEARKTIREESELLALNVMERVLNRRIAT